MGKKGKEYNRPFLTEKRKDMLFGYALLAPTFAIFAIVVLFPILNGVLMSFCNYTFFTLDNPHWNRFENYKYIFNNGFLKYLWHTIVFTVATVSIELLIGMSVALLLNSNIKGRSLFRSLYLMPWVIPSIVTALLWSWFFQPQYGTINYILNSFGLLKKANMVWLQAPSRAMFTVIAGVVWRQTPYMLVMILAGLQSVKQELIEAAAIDGASSTAIFFKIVLPSIKMVLGTTIITCVMSSFQQFTIIYNMTAGGPLNATTTLSIAAYKLAFTKYDLGAGAAIGVIWMVLLGTIISIFNIKSKRFDGE